MKPIIPITISFFLVFGLITSTVFAYVASSNSYRIQADSVNVGGVLSTSASYKIEDTLGESASGISTSASYKFNAGYQNSASNFLSISAPANVSLSSISGVAGGTTNGSVTWTITTDAPAGYTATVKTSSNPAMTYQSNNIADYTSAGGDPDFDFFVEETTAEFGFSPEGSDLVARYRDDGSRCNAGSSDLANHCWDAFGTTAKTLARSSAANHPSGADLKLRFQVKIGRNYQQTAGLYTASIVLTALPN